MNVRKSSLKVNNSEWDKFIAAFDGVIRNGKLAEFVGFHTMMRRIHGEAVPGLWRFLPWHRAYVLEFEKELQRIDSSVTIPYWDWPQQSLIPPKLANYQGLAESREPGVHPRGNFPDQGLIDAIMGETNFRTFANRLESEAHNSVHRWVGGDMNTMMNSPRDPLFWIHHSAVDRYWYLWQVDNYSNIPGALGADRIMDPWTHTIDDLLDIRKLDYAYDAAPAKPIATRPTVSVAGLVDAMLPYKLRKAIYFKGSNCIEFHLHKGRPEGSLKPISSVFPGMSFSNGVDAAVKWAGGKVFFFKDDQCVRYDLRKRQQDSGFPQLIDNYFPEIGFTTIDAAVKWDRRTVYFFSGSQFTRYNLKAGRVDGSGFPRLISHNFPGLTFEDDIDATLCHRGKTYFVKGAEYSRFNIRQWQQDFGFSRPITGNWPVLDLKD